MKIINNNIAYVQKKDITYLCSLNPIIPNSTDLKIRKLIFLENEQDQYEFVEFNEKVDIDYFKNLSWIIDYNDFKCFSESEITLLQQDISTQRKNISDKYKLLPKEEKKKNTNLLMQCELLLYKIESLNDVILYKQGLLKLPNKSSNKIKIKKKSKFKENTKNV